jgi:hypothetical protein
MRSWAFFLMSFSMAVASVGGRQGARLFKWGGGL